MVGYTPQVVTSVWFGNVKQPSAIYGNYHNTIGPAHNYDVYGREEPGYIWQAYMNSYLQGQPVQPFAAGQVITGVPTSSSPPPTTSDTPTPTTTDVPTTTETPSPTWSRPTRSRRTAGLERGCLPP
jgi:membrane peptidoglycan carboxypeptidase